MTGSVALWVRLMSEEERDWWRTYPDDNPFGLTDCQIMRINGHMSKKYGPDSLVTKNFRNTENDERGTYTSDLMQDRFVGYTEGPSAPNTDAMDAGGGTYRRD